MPDQNLSTVRVSAHAIGQPGPWSVTAYAVCVPAGVVAPHRVRGISTGWSAGTGCLDPDNVLYGIGFEVFGSDGTTRLDALVPSFDLTQVGVHVSGNAPPAALAVYGICAPFVGGHQRCWNVAPAPGTLPTGCFPRVGDGMAFGAGGRVAGEGLLHLDALVPSSGPGTDGSVRAQRLGTVEGSTKSTTAARLASAGGDSSSVTAYGDLIGSWY